MVIITDIIKIVGSSVYANYIGPPVMTDAN